jgi:hypothetical protein
MVTSPKGTEYEVSENKETKDKDITDEKEFTNAQGVTFTPTAEMVDDMGGLIPYGLPCVRELFRLV